MDHVVLGGVCRAVELSVSVHRDRVSPPYLSTDSLSALFLMVSFLSSVLCTIQHSVVSRARRKGCYVPVADGLVGDLDVGRLALVLFGGAHRVGCHDEQCDQEGSVWLIEKMVGGTWMLCASAKDERVRKTRC